MPGKFNPAAAFCRLPGIIDTLSFTTPKLAAAFRMAKRWKQLLYKTLCKAEFQEE